MQYLKKVVQKGSKIGKEWTGAGTEDQTNAGEPAKIIDGGDMSTAGALSNKHILIDKIGQLLQYYNEKELKIHADQMRSEDKESFYSMLLTEQQNFYENQLRNEFAKLKELKAQLSKRVAETDADHGHADHESKGKSLLERMHLVSHNEPT